MRKPPADPDPLAAVFDYHERTKHHFHRYARSLGVLDWATQPDPFRTYPGASTVRLMPPAEAGGFPYDRIFHPEKIPPRPLDAASVSELLFFSLALSAWKSYRDSRWALRVNPSSGNLHPTEAYLLLPGGTGLGDGAALWHYVSRDHALERRADFRGALPLRIPPGAFLVGLTSIAWREAWKYGERAYRYCQHDVGHALAALRIAAAGLGWTVAPVATATDGETAALLGVDRAGEFHDGEREEAELLAVVAPGIAPPDTRGWDGAGARRLAAEASWHGAADRLSPAHHEWEAIERVAAACGRADPAPAEAPASPARMLDEPERPPSFHRIVRGRRSAVAFDGATSISRDAFTHMLARTVPALCPLPWDAWPHPPRVDLGLFVHRVDGLEPGLYALCRSVDGAAALRSALDPAFAWTTPPGSPIELGLFFLRAGDVRALARRVSCDQEIAADGAFSLGMIAQFEAPLRRLGAGYYRRLFWETGLIGQVLYLEAEAAGVRGTGIGCFFDDAVHEVFGLAGRARQSLYHFTIGGPVEDTRLTTGPAYPVT